MSEVNPESLTAEQALHVMNKLSCRIFHYYISPASDECNRARRENDLDELSQDQPGVIAEEDKNFAAVCRTCPVLLQALQGMNL